MVRRIYLGASCTSIPQAALSNRQHQPQAASVTMVARLRTETGSPCIALGNAPSRRGFNLKFFARTASGRPVLVTGVQPKTRPGHHHWHWPGALASDSDSESPLATPPARSRRQSVVPLAVNLRVAATASEAGAKRLGQLEYHRQLEGYRDLIVPSTIQVVP